MEQLERLRIKAYQREVRPMAIIDDWAVLDEHGRVSDDQALIGRPQSDEGGLPTLRGVASGASRTVRTENDAH